MGKFNNSIKKEFSIIPNALINDSKLSAIARFVFCLMASKPTDWEFVQSILAKEIGFSTQTLKKYLDELVKSKWITKGEQKNVKGVWGGHSYTLHQEPLYKKYRSVEKPIRKVYITNKKDKNTKKDKKRKKRKDIPPNPNKPTLLERNKKYLPLAKKLAKIIQKKKNITHTTDQLKSWANDLRQLEESNKISIPRMKAVLKWYKINIGGQYIPVIESGSSFRSKFTKLEDAINRQENPIKQNNQPAPRNGYMSKEAMDDLREFEKENTETL